MKHKLLKTSPVIVLKFNDPTCGYWNRGRKSGGTFHPRPNYDGTIEWGSFELNYWIRVKFGLSWKHAAAFAKNVIKRSCRVPCTAKVEWQ